MEEFKALLDLRASCSKSGIFFGGVLVEIKAQVSHVLELVEGQIVKYLDLPLISGKLPSKGYKRQIRSQVELTLVLPKNYHLLVVFN